MVGQSEATTNSLQLVPLAFCFNFTHIAYGFHERVLQSLHITWFNIRIQIDRYMYSNMYLHTHAYIHVHTHLHMYTHKYEHKNRNAISLGVSLESDIAHWLFYCRCWKANHVLFKGCAIMAVQGFSVCLHNWASHTQHKTIIPYALHQAYIMITNTT